MWPSLKSFLGNWRTVNRHHSLLKISICNMVMTGQGIVHWRVSCWYMELLTGIFQLSMHIPVWKPTALFLTLAFANQGRKLSSKRSGEKSNSAKDAQQPCTPGQCSETGTIGRLAPRRWAGARCLQASWILLPDTLAIWVFSPSYVTTSHKLSVHTLGRTKSWGYCLIHTFCFAANWWVSCCLLCREMRKLFKRKGYQRREKKESEIFTGPESIVLPLLLPGQASELPGMDKAPV